MLKTFLPELYPNELWYSIIARYHYDSGNFHILDTMQDLFGERRVLTFDICLAANLAKLENVVPSNILSAETIMTEHTLAPFFSRNDSDIMKGIALYCAKQNRHPADSFGFVNGYSQSLRYCPMCREEDTLRFGVPYWHKEHQVSFLPYCIHHHCELYPAVIPKNTFLPAQALVRPSTKVIPCSFPFPYESLLEKLLFSPDSFSFTENDILFALVRAGYTTFEPFTLLLDDLKSDIRQQTDNYSCFNHFDLQWLSRRKRCVSNETWLLLLGFLKDFLQHNDEPFNKWYARKYGRLNKHRRTA